jgi:prolyl oligopeptidase
LSSYESDNTDWKGVLDLDKIAEEEDIPWVWRGIRVLPRCRDPSSEDGKMVRRAMITLQREASNTVSVREFDLLTSNFVTDDAFSLPEGRSRVSYKGRDVLYVASDLDGGSLTTAGNPLTVREWTRGTLLEDAPVVFEGRDSDIGASSYIDDQRLRGGDIFEVQIRSVRLNSSDFFVRKVKAEHLLAKHDPRRKCMSEAGSFQQLQLPGDSQIDFVGNLLLITLCSDWSPEPGEEFKERSVIYVNAHKFIKYGPVDRIYHTLFQPSKGVVCETYHVTKQFLVLSVRDKIKSKLEFYKLEKDANKLRLVGMDKNPQIRVNHVQPLDPYDGDGFWLTTSGYTEPTTVWLADAAKMDSKDKKLIRKTGSEEYMVRKLKALPNQFDSSDIHVMQKFVPSMDGTEIPYFLLMKKGTQLDRSNPTLLYAYGGFGVTLSPNYAASIGLAWLERGGVYAEANIRGGGEFGPGWHKV